MPRSAVHNSKLTLIVHGPSLGAAGRRDSRQRDIAKADRERASFIAAMGINHELDDLIKTVKFENLHVLTRPELYRFGIDTRTVRPKPPWMLEAAARPYVRKIVLAEESRTARRFERWSGGCSARTRIARG